MAKTARDAQKHMDALSDFFADIKSATIAEMEAFMSEHKKEKHLRQSLKRLKDKKFLVERSGKIYPTKSGGCYFKRRVLKQKVGRDKKTAKERWDGRWRLITFDIPVKEHRKRDLMKVLLIEFNFYILQHSVYVCPNNIAEEFWELLVEYDLDKFCKAMVVEFLEGDEGIRRHFFDDVFKR